MPTGGARAERRTLFPMGEYVRSRVLRALGLGTVWAQLEALSTRMRRIEKDVQTLQQAPRGLGLVQQNQISAADLAANQRAALSPLGQTIPAPGGAPPAGNRIAERDNPALAALVEAWRDGKKP